MPKNTKSNIRPIEKFPPTRYNYVSKNTKKYVPQKSKPMKLPEMFSQTQSGIDIDKKLKFNLNMNWGKGGYNPEKYFDRLYSIYPDTELDGLCQYVFLVRPDLNLFKSGTTNLQNITEKQRNKGYRANSSPKQDEFMNYMKNQYEFMLRNLSTSGFSDHDFIPYLVGRTESIQIPDLELKDYNLTQPYTGFNFPYASHAFASMTGGDCEITFRDDKELRIHKMFNAWVYYIHAVTTNIFEPKIGHIKHNRMDYATSIYVFTCKPDAKTILFWSKYTGAFPKSVPNSDLSVNLRGTPENKCRIPFKYFHHEPLDPRIIIDFNKNSHLIVDPTRKTYVPIYRSEKMKDIGFKKNMFKSSKSFSKSDPAVLGSGNGLVGAPFVCINDQNLYELRWKPIANLSP